MEHCLKRKTGPTTITNRLRQWRCEEGLTLEEVSDLVGLSVSALSRIERGERNVPPLTKVRIARRLAVPVRDLFEVEEVSDEVA